MVRAKATSSQETMNLRLLCGLDRKLPALCGYFIGGEVRPFSGIRGCAEGVKFALMVGTGRR
ncbi:MAG: hypothetical protein ACR2IP_04040 [Solirubrobacteraceae bacterium]